MSGYLEGLRVLDLSRLLPGPYASLLLAEMGADVIKVEDTRTGDAARAIPPMIGDTSAVYMALNAGKRNISVDLKKEEGREIVLRLVKTYDIVIDGFRPGTLKRLGLGYDALKQANPGVILCALTGYGQTGAYRDRAGHDLNYQSLSGIVELTGRAGEAPGLPGTQMADLSGSYAAVLSILGAVFKRLRTGEGAFLDVSMCESLLALQPITMAEVFCSGARPSRGGTPLNGRFVCYNIYETKDGRHMSFGALEPKFFMAFCEATERPDLMAHHYAEANENSEPYREFRELFRSRSQAEWVELLKDVDACCEPVLNLADFEEHEHFKSRNLVRSRELPGGHVFKRVTNLPALSEGEENLRPSAGLGEHSDEILRELGYSGEEIERLEAENVIKRPAGTAATDPKSGGFI